MPLQAVHDKLEEIPEQYRDLYTEKNNKYELTGITGVKTQADIDRIQLGLVKERDAHKATKVKLTVWDGMDHTEVVTKLDKYPELEAAAQGKLDENAIEEIVNKRVEGTIKSQTAPLQRELDNVVKERDTHKEQLGTLLLEKRTRTIHDSVRQELVKAKVISEAHEDALLLADRVFEVREDDGVVVTRDQVGVTPGITADLWLSEIQEKRPHWWPASQGGGALGGREGGGSSFAENPFSHEHWNMTKQGEVVRGQGIEKAEQMAKAAGITMGSPRPPAPK